MIGQRRAPNDIACIVASARRIDELASKMPESKRREFVVETATIIRLVETSFASAGDVAAGTLQPDVPIGAT